MSFRTFSFLFLGLAMVAQVGAQTPTISQPIGSQTLVTGGPSITINLQNHFAVSDVTGPVVQFDTVKGVFNVELRSDIAPKHVENFLKYVQAEEYNNSFFHRAASFDNAAVSIIQGGGYRSAGGSLAVEIPKLANVDLEYNAANARGTLAAARTTAVNSANSEWFFNVRDNSTLLGESNGGGYTVFGRVLGNGMTVVDAIAALNRITAGGAFTELPVQNYTVTDPATPVSAEHLIIVHSITETTMFPTGGGTSVVAFSVQNSAGGVVGHTLSGSTLTIDPLTGGSANLTVRAVTTEGAAVETSFAVTVTTLPPEMTRQPVSQSAAVGSTVVFNASASHAPAFQWYHDGVAITGATSGILVLAGVTSADAGTYHVVGTNAVGTVTSNSVTLTVNPAGAVAGRLSNMSVRTSAGAGSRALTLGAVVGPLDSTGSLPLLVRAVGPGLQPYNVPNLLADPVLGIHLPGSNTPFASNDNWGGGAELANAFAAVGAFELPAGSLDSALLVPAPGLAAGSYTVQVTGKGDATGTVLAELYDAAGATRTATTPRLMNLSVLKQLVAGESLTAGFVIEGSTTRTVLIRAAGPVLSEFGVPTPMANPALAVFNALEVQIAENDNWGGDQQLTNIGAAVGAFPLTSFSSRDSALLVTLAPGEYTVQVNAVDGAAGAVLVEVYEVQ